MPWERERIDREEGGGEEGEGERGGKRKVITQSRK